MAQYRPMMAGHPLSQQWKKEGEEGFYTTSLHIAALEGDKHALLGLLRAGEFVDAPDHDLKTPLHLATAYGQEGTMELLLRAGANVAARSDHGETPLMAAVTNDQAMVVQRLLSREQDVNAADMKGLTALHLAAKGGSADLINVLVSAGCNVEARDEFGRTPLHHALANRHTDATKALLRCRADPISATHSHESAVHVAVAQGRPDLLACLIQEVPGSSLDELRNSQGNSPLVSVALVSVVSEQHMLQMAELLLARGMQIDQPGMLGWTCLHAAVRRKQKSLAAFLLQKGADPLFRAQDGLSVKEFVLQNQQKPGYSDLLDLFGH